MEYNCICGYDINHPKIIHKTEYSKLGWLLLTVLGLSAKPKIVKFICPECSDILMSSSDPEILSKYVGR